MPASNDVGFRMVPGWWRVFVYSFVIYVPLLLYLGFFWMSMIQAAIIGFVVALAIGMVLNMIVPFTIPSAPLAARKVPKAVARKVPKDR